MNAYVLVCPQTRASVLVDPGAEPETLAELLAGTQPAAILVTHAHPDHIGALAEMRRRLRVPVMAHGGGTVQTDQKLFGGERLPVGRQHLIVYATPGHTADQLCFGVEDIQDTIVGDTIFDGGPGKTWSAEDFQTTLKTLRRVVLAWPDDTVCHPGHGAAFRLGDIRGAAENFLAKDHGRFFGDAAWGQ
jgi:glyoxylase-like metal-dependent hydrolase (beta-lactamase superfamily II)